MNKVSTSRDSGNSGGTLEELSAKLDEISRRLDALPDATADAVRTCPSDAMLDVRGVAAKLNVSERQVERIIADGAILPVWIGGVRRFTREAIDSYLRAAAKPRRRRRAAR